MQRRTETQKIRRALLAVAAPAMLALSACHSPDAVIRDRNIATVRKFLLLLEEENIEEFVALYAETGRQINPYASGLFPDRIEGRQALLDFWRPVPARFDGMRFTLIEVHAMQDPNLVLARFSGKIKLRGKDRYYENDYFGLFRFNPEGRIEEYVEIFNPLTVVRAFDLKDKI